MLQVHQASADHKFVMVKMRARTKATSATVAVQQGKGHFARSRVLTKRLALAEVPTLNQEVKAVISYVMGRPPVKTPLSSLKGSQMQQNGSSPVQGKTHVLVSLQKSGKPANYSYCRGGSKG